MRPVAIQLPLMKANIRGLIKMIRISLNQLISKRLLINTYGNMKLVKGDIVLTFPFNDKKIALLNYKEICKKLKAEEVD